MYTVFQLENPQTKYQLGKPPKRVGNNKTILKQGVDNVFDSGLRPVL
jgi:hypothetical protein